MQGVLGTSRNAGTSLANWEPQQLLGFAVIGYGHEVLDVAGGGAHAVALTTLQGRATRDEPRRTIVWGDNSKGQIGESRAGDAPAVLPRRLLRSLFPLYPLSNLVDNTNNRVCYKMWNTTLQDLFLTTGLRGLNDIELDINEKMGGNYVQITTDEDTDRVSLHVIKSGLQLDFITPGCRALADRFSFSRAYFKLPAKGVLGEVHFILSVFLHCRDVIFQL